MSPLIKYLQLSSWN